MKWKQLLDRRNNAGLVLVTILIMMILLLFTHQKNLSKMQDALSSIYQDRLVAESHLYNLSHKIYEKKILLGQFDDSQLEQYVLVNDHIRQLISEYEETYLTEEEGVRLSALKDHIQKSQQVEQLFVYSASPLHRDALTSGLIRHYDSILAGLNDLTTLQLQEGQKLIDQSKRIVASNTTTSHLEIGLLIVLGLLFVFLTFSTAQVPARHYTPHLH